jgi:hypothetical protein
MHKGLHVHKLITTLRLSQAVSHCIGAATVLQKMLRPNGTLVPFVWLERGLHIIYPLVN